MKLSTTRFGEIEVTEENIITYPEGIIGFPNNKRYFLVSQQGGIFQWLQSVETPELAFVVVDPVLICPKYEIFLSRAELETINLTNEGDSSLLVIVVVPSNPQDMTANLLAPLIVNNKENLGRQIVLNDDRYPLKYHIVSELAKYKEINHAGSDQKA